MPATSRSRSAMASPPTPSAATTSTVSSPATVPTTSSTPLRSSAEPTTCAEPGGVRSTTRFPEYATSTTHSPSTRRKWSSGAIWCTGNSGNAYAVSPPGNRTFTAPRSSRSRDTVVCVASTPCSASNATSWAWLVTGSASSSFVMRCWRWFLVSRASRRTARGGLRLAAGPRSAHEPTAQAKMPRMAVRRWAACFQTTERGPSSTPSVISSPRCAGRQCSTTASGAVRSTSASSIV